MSCVANCQRESPEFNLRPIGIDYGLPWLLPKSVQSKKLALSQVETNFWLGGIICILQGSVLLHYLPKILVLVGMDPEIATAGPARDWPFAFHAIFSLSLLGFPGGLSLISDLAAIPLESAVRVIRRQLTRRPAENSAIKTLYEAMIKQNADLTSAIFEWDQDGDGTVSDWEMIEAFKLLDIPTYEYDLLLNLLGKEESRTVSSLFDDIQELYFDSQEAQTCSKGLAAAYGHQLLENDFETKLSFVEIFNRLDKNGTGFVSKEEFATLSNSGYFKKPLEEVELNDLFDQADVLGNGRLNLFEFMMILRKNVKVGIQEIGYGYLPLAWGSLTAYWLGLGMQELGLTLMRVPSTFGFWVSSEVQESIPHYVFDLSTIHNVQFCVMLTSCIASVALTQKLCDDNRIGPVRFGTHAITQSIGAAMTLYLMLAPEVATVWTYR
jgi:Ca2+-binding EF-hand superfamily protein